VSRGSAAEELVVHGEVVSDGPVLGDLALGQAEGVRVLDIEGTPGGFDAGEADEVEPCLEGASSAHFGDHPVVGCERLQSLETHVRERRALGPDEFGEELRTVSDTAEVGEVSVHQLGERVQVPGVERLIEQAGDDLHVAGCLAGPGEICGSTHGSSSIS
jgi:hypothetical protein